MGALLIPYKASQTQKVEKLLQGLRKYGCEANSFTICLDKMADKEFSLSAFSSEDLNLGLIDPELLNKAFFLRENEFTAYGILLALGFLLERGEHEIIIVGPEFECEQIEWDEMKVDSIHATMALRAPSGKVQLGDITVAGLKEIRIHAGALLQKYVKWCIDCFTDLYRGGYSSIADTPHTGENGDHEAAFYLEWLYYAPAFGVSLNIKPAEGVASDIFAEEKEAGYAWETFADGVPIHPLLKPYFVRNYRLRFACANNPFEHRCLFTDNTVVAGERTGIPLTAMADCIWLNRPDLQKAFPEYRSAQRHAYMQWYASNAGCEYGLPQEYIAAVENALEENGAAMEHEHEGPLGKLAKLVRGAKEPILVAQKNSPRLEKGITLCAHIRGDYGIGEASRALASSIQAAAIPLGIVEIASERNYSYTSHDWDSHITNRFDFNVNLLYTNADGISPFLEDISTEAIMNRYNIGQWSWEMPEFPDKWISSFEPLNEVWTISQYAVDAIAAKSPVPVINIPHCISLPPAPEQFDREYFGLGPEFVFLTMYDVRSISARKNPMGAVKAFIKAFGDRQDIQLCVKVNAPAGWKPEGELLKLLNTHKNIVLLNRFLSRSQLNALLFQCNAFVSLHRCEGFGLGPAEAMFYGRAAVLTNWSGNTEYMRPDACCPVRYDIVELDKDYGPYRKGWHWAEPDIEDAAQQMQRLVEDGEFYKIIAKNGQKVIKTEFSPEVIGKRIKKRLDMLKLL